jgi:hypothetical protein
MDPLSLVSSFPKSTGGRGEDFFGARPKLNYGTPFNLVPINDGRASFQFQRGRLYNPDYFQPGRGGSLADAYDPHTGIRHSAMGQGTSRGPDGFKPAVLGNQPTPGFLSDPSMPATQVVIESYDARAELPGDYDLVIMERIPQTRSQELALVSEVSGLVVDRTPRFAFTLPAFNHFLASKQKKIGTEEDFFNLHPDEEFGVDWHDPHSILSKFYVFGVCSDSETDQRRRTYAFSGMSTRGMSGSERRAIDAVINGRWHVHNHWQRNLPVGTHLFLVLRPVERPKYYITNDFNAATTNKLTFSSEEADTLEEFPFQLVPAWSKFPKPDDKDRAYMNGFNCRVLAPYVTVGRVYKGDTPGIPMKEAESLRDVAYIRKQGLLDIVLFE